GMPDSVLMPAPESTSVRRPLNRLAACSIAPSRIRHPRTPSTGRRGRATRAMRFVDPPGGRVDPDDPGEIVRVPIADRTEVRALRLQVSNFTEPLRRFDFLTYLKNSV